MRKQKTFDQYPDFKRFKQDYDPQLASPWARAQVVIYRAGERHFQEVRDTIPKKE